MNFVQPQSKVIIRSGVPLNERYEDTWIFPNHATQYNYFINSRFNVHSDISTSSPASADVYSPLTYQRVESGVIRIRENAENILNANYLMFTNDRTSVTDSAKKWYYCFITETPKYINENVTEIRYEIDVMQTYLPDNMINSNVMNINDYRLNQCFVKREHIAFDYFGANIETESLDIGPYEYERINMVIPAEPNPVEPFDITNYDIVIFTSEDVNTQTSPPTFTPKRGGWVGGVYSGVGYVAFDATTELSDANDMIEAFTEANKAASIIGIYMVPKVFVGSYGTATAYRPDNNFNPFDKFVGTHNEKVKQYPFNLLLATDNNGNSANYRYELFTQNSSRLPTVMFAIMATFSPPPECAIAPVGYAGIGANSVNYTQQLKGLQFPQCSYNIDGYAAWLAQNSIVWNAGVANTLVNAPFAVMSGAVSGATNMPAAPGFGAVLGIAGAAVNTLTQINQQMAVKDQAATLPAQANGRTSGIAQLANNQLRYSFYKTTIKDEYITKIDQYFDMFGYATNRVKVPNIDVRNCWCYVSTIGCEVDGSIPKDAANKINSIYDNGIRLWRTESADGRIINVKISDYEQDNSTI